MEKVNLDFKEWKDFQGKNVFLIALPCKIVSGRVNLFKVEKFQLFFLINVGEWPKSEKYRAKMIQL